MASETERIRCLQDILRDNGLAGAILFNSRDIFYYTNNGAAFLLVVRPEEFKLFVRRGYDIALRESWLHSGRISDERRLER